MVNKRLAIALAATLFFSRTVDADTYAYSELIVLQDQKTVRSSLVLKKSNYIDTSNLYLIEELINIDALREKKSILLDKNSQFKEIVYKKTLR